MFDSHGRRLPFIYRYAGDQMVTNAPPRNVRLRAAGFAVFVFNKNVRVTTGPTARLARTLRVGLPGSRRTLSVPLPSYLFIDYWNWN